MITDACADSANMQKLAVGDVFKGRNGQKLAIVNLCVLTPIEPCRCPFPAGVYNGDGTEVRVSLDLQLTGSNIKLFEDLDRQILKLAHERSVEWFGKQLTPDVIESKYLRMCRYREGEELPRLRCKVNLESVRCWNQKKEPVLDIPSNRFQGMLIRPRLQLLTVWFMSTQFGCSVQVTDIQLPDDAASQDECPF